MKRRLGNSVEFLNVYVREAHPTDGWRMSSNDKMGIEFAQPTTKNERDDVAAKCCQALHMTMPLLVDDLDDHVGHLYSGMPDRLYVIGRDGRVVYKGGRGPFGFRPGEMEQSLIMHLLEEVPAPPRQQGRLPVLSDDEAWKRLPKAEEGGQPLPVWARALAGAMPRTTAAMLELDHRQRAGSPLDPKLRGKMRWVAADANKSPYGTAYALADLKKAGAIAEELKTLTGDPKHWPAADRPALTFARKLTLAASTVTDAEVKQLRDEHGDAAVVAMVQLLAYANFQDRLLLTLDLPVEANGPLPPLAVRFAKDGPAPSVPPRKRPANASAPGKAPPDSDWAKLDFDYLQKQLSGQKDRETRIPVPSWEEVKKRYPPGAPLPPVPVRIRWSLVCTGYQPELAVAWTKCTRTFGEETAQDRVFEESLFWVVTRSLECFY
jgi:alkylhydroperoxidase family enzyme